MIINFRNKILMIFVAVLLGVLGFATASNMNRAFAQSPATYSSEYSVTNFYTDDGFLEYYFSGLDVTESYQWALQAINSDGSRSHIISVKHSLGAVTQSVLWSGALGEFALADGDNYIGAAIVVDQYGKTVGQHYMLPGCNLLLSLICSGFDWGASGTAVSSPTARHIIGKSGNLHELNVDNYFHVYDDVSAVVTKQGFTSFLHFRFLPGSTNEYRIYDKSNSASLWTIDHQDLESYNTDYRNSFLTPYNPTYSFVVINTNGVLPKNINRVQDLIAWANGDNPHSMLVAKGAYDYVEYTSGSVWVADGESTWLVGNNPTREFWSTSAQEHISASGDLRSTFVSETEGIFDSGYFDHELNDSLMGSIDSTNYDYAKLRPYDYTVFGVQSADVLSTWSIYPTLSNLNTATLAHRRFDVELVYDIDQTISIADRAEQNLADLGMNSLLGRALAMLIIMFIVFAVIAKYGTGSIYAYGIAFIAVGGGWIAIGLSDGLITILFGITAIALIWMMIGSRGSESGGGM